MCLRQVEEKWICIIVNGKKTFFGVYILLITGNMCCTFFLFVRELLTCQENQYVQILTGQKMSLIIVFKKRKNARTRGEKWISTQVINIIHWLASYKRFLYNRSILKKDLNHLCFSFLLNGNIKINTKVE